MFQGLLSRIVARNYKSYHSIIRCINDTSIHYAFNFVSEINFAINAYLAALNCGYKETNLF